MGVLTTYSVATRLVRPGLQVLENLLLELRTRHRAQHGVDQLTVHEKVHLAVVVRAHDMMPLVRAQAVWGGPNGP